VEPQPKQARMAYFEALCREHGLSRTVQRRTILEALLDREDHPTADQVYELVKDRIPGVSLTTVYRVLDTLVEIGVITKLCHAGGTVRYDPKMHRHHHLVCLHCERILDLEDEKLNALSLPPVGTQGFEIRDFHIHLRGICPECLAGRGRRNKGPSRSSRRCARPAKSTGGGARIARSERQRKRRTSRPIRRKGKRS